MSVVRQTLALSLIACVCAAFARADDALAVHVVYDRERGELSEGTGAPKREQMLNAVKSAAPTRLQATLEYGERVECFECIPLLADKLLRSDDAQVREIAAWWLRRRSFGFGPVMEKITDVVQHDADPERRARAAAALGEFLDRHAAPTLSAVADADAEGSVRAAAVRALGRLNVPDGLAAISRAMADADVSVRAAALEQVLKVKGFSDTAAVLERLTDADRDVRRAAVQLSGELRLSAASERLTGALQTDDSPQVRQAAAFALGRIGGAGTADVLARAESSERDAAVLDAITVARRMR
jgi:HEAT repeat protein